jgi:uncharacterized C2H2 Zn-finger protein
MERCCKCNREFKNESEYLKHTCNSGFKPTDPKNMGKNYLEIQKAALKRGAETKI